MLKIHGLRGSTFQILNLFSGNDCCSGTLLLNISTEVHLTPEENGLVSG